MLNALEGCLFDLRLEFFEDSPSGVLLGLVVRRRPEVTRVVCSTSKGTLANRPRRAAWTYLKRLSRFGLIERALYLGRSDIRSAKEEGLAFIGFA